MIQPRAKQQPGRHFRRLLNLHRHFLFAAGSMALPRPNSHPGHPPRRPLQPVLPRNVSMVWGRDFPSPKNGGRRGEAGKMVPTLHDGFGRESNCGWGLLGHGR